ncbi:MAG: sulfite exporter TauE/SafE family protein, partial [Desulfovibrionaceae bacterium]|nr:sulfite exporter TauE/SafE family protein [Desulfovibrionaceae bacterium]
MIQATMLFLSVGLVGGFFSGLLGIGGGIIMVPLLSLAFSLLGVEPGQIYRLAVGTSLAGIAFTSFSSALSHHRRIPLRKDLIKGLAPWLVAGTLAGSSVATRINPLFLKAFFTLFIFALALRMLTGFKAAQREKPVAAAVSAVAGVLIGGFCSLVGIGGGTIIVPYLHWNCNSMPCAVGVSAG